jgi:hypothetical protein
MPNQRIANAPSQDIWGFPLFASLVIFISSQLTEGRNTPISRQVTRTLVARKGTLALLGFSEQEIDGLDDLSQYSLQDLKRISDEKKYKDLGLNGKSTQKIIPKNDLRQAIVDGWELVMKLEGTNEAIVRLPK